MRRYRGRVIIDYDEWDPTPSSPCALRQVMDGSVSARALAAELESRGMLGATLAVENLFAANMEVEGNVTNVHIVGDGNVVGDGNHVVTTINKTLASDPDRAAIAEALALLRGEIETLHVPEKFKRRSDRATQDAEDELAETDPDADADAALRRVAETMNEAGETYDAAAGWGLRLAQVVEVLSRLVPAAAHDCLPDYRIAMTSHRSRSARDLA